MSIAAQDSLGVYGECPNCHASISHGFQVCANCGHAVSADEQQELQTSVWKSVASYFSVATASIVIVLYFSYKYFG